MGRTMAVWKNGRNMDFLHGKNKLTHGDVQTAVNSMTFCGLQTAAASFFLLCQKIGIPPKETAEILENEGKK